MFAFQIIIPDSNLMHLFVQRVSPTSVWLYF